MGDRGERRPDLSLSPRYHFWRRFPPIFSRDFAYPDRGRVELLIGGPSHMDRRSIKDITAKTFAEFLSGPMVEIYVGPQRKCWSLHRNLLCHHSSYFDAELRGHELVQNNESELGLELPNDDPRGFELLVKWLYQGELDQLDLTLTDIAKYESATDYLKLHMLCDRLDMLQLKNEAMDVYRRGLCDAGLVPDAQETNEIYRAAPKHSAVRTLMTDIAARQIMDPAVERGAENYRQCFSENEDFAVDLVNAIRSMSGGTLLEDPTDGQRCLYHDHEDGIGCHLAKLPKNEMEGSPTTLKGIPANSRRGSVAETTSEPRRRPRKLSIGHRNNIQKKVTEEKTKASSPDVQDDHQPVLERHTRSDTNPRISSPRSSSVSTSSSHTSKSSRPRSASAASSVATSISSSRTNSPSSTRNMTVPNKLRNRPSVSFAEKSSEEPHVPKSPQPQRKTSNVQSVIKQFNEISERRVPTAKTLSNAMPQRSQNNGFVRNTAPKLGRGSFNEK